MHAKIMLLPGTAAGEKLRPLAEAMLTEISAAFDHSFVLMQGKIGEKAVAVCGEALPENTLRACLQCQAVLLCDTACESAQALLDEMDMPLRIRSLCVPASLCGRHEAPVSLYIAQSFSIDSDTIRRAMRAAFRFAQGEDARVMIVPANGPAGDEFLSAARVQAVDFPQLSWGDCSAQAAVTGMISAPERMGMTFCPPYAGGILTAAGTALCSRPGLIYDASMDDSAPGVYGPLVPPEDDGLSPFGLAGAIAAMLRYSLGLQREAACLEAAVNNVQSAGWQSAGADAEASAAQTITRRVCEQIAVAGELLTKGGFPGGVAKA